MHACGQAVQSTAVQSTAGTHPNVQIRSIVLLPRVEALGAIRAVGVPVPMATHAPAGYSVLS